MEDQRLFLKSQTHFNFQNFPTTNKILILQFSNKQTTTLHTQLVRLFTWPNKNICKFAPHQTRKANKLTHPLMKICWALLSVGTFSWPPPEWVIQGVVRRRGAKKSCENSANCVSVKILSFLKGEDWRVEWDLSWREIVLVVAR
jgi:hypothetical protein